MKDESSVLILKRFVPGPNPRGAGSDETITELALATVRDRAVSAPEASNPNEISPQVMLRLITYCYAKGIYGSGEIERKLRKSPIRQDIPDAKSIRRFRRANRVALQSALEKTLGLMHRSSASDQTLIIARREASEKLETAAIVDMSLEE